MKGWWITMVAAGLAACATTVPSKHVAPDESMPDGTTVACEGEFDAAPTLVSGKSPIFPASTLNNPDFIENRKVRRLPFTWEVETQFDVLADGTTARVRSNSTDPKFFATHTNAAIGKWRFNPARRDGEAVMARCTHVLHFKIDA